MRSRLRRWLPGFPAVLAMPVGIVAWAGIWADTNYHGEKQWLFDFPMRFVVGDVPGYGWTIWGVEALLVDSILALAVAWALAMAVDRLVFPFIRRRRRSERATPSEPS